MNEQEKEYNDRIKAAIDHADSFFRTLNRIKDTEDHETWIKICYGMYIGMRYNDHVLCRTAMLEMVQDSAEDMQSFIQKYIDKIEEELAEAEKETEDE